MKQALKKSVNLILEKISQISLFEILDCQVRDYHEYDAENYVRGAGFVDIALKVSGKVVVYIEAKKFGGVPSRHVVQDFSYKIV